MTTTLTDAPEDAEGVNTQPSAVPVFEKSPAAIPDTLSPKDTPNVSDIAAAGDDGCDEYDAVGGSTSIVIVAAAVSPPGPNWFVEEPRTAFCSIVTMTVPEVGAPEETVRTYVDPEPVREATAQPELVPVTEKSVVARSVTFSEKTMS